MFVKINARTRRGLLGCAFNPLPNARATRLLRLKSEAGYEFPQHGHANFVWLFELTTLLRLKLTNEMRPR
jgi:hypothetical protein